MEWGLRRISSRELSEWAAFAQIEPIGGERGDLQAALVASTLANVHRDPAQRPEPYTPGDFMLRFDEAPEEGEQSAEEQLAIVELINAAFGGNDLRQN